MRRTLQLTLALATVALLTATSASSRSDAGGVSVTVSVMVALKSMDQSSGIATVGYVTAARWNPETLQEEVFLTFKDVTEGAESGAGTPPCCNRPHSSNRYSDVFVGFAGHRMDVAAKWHVYDPPVGVGPSGEREGRTAYTIPKQEPAPRLEDDDKALARQYAQMAFGNCAIYAAGGVVFAATGGAPIAVGFGIAAALSCAAGFYNQRIAEDPVDLNFRSIARPRIPPVRKVVAGEGLPAGAARGLNDLLAVQAREAGLARAIATAFDRSQGAHVKKAVYWEKKQVRAAGTYGSQLASALLADASLRPKVKAALADSAFGDVTVTYEDALAFGESLVLKGIPADVTGHLTKLGLTKAEQRDVRAQAATLDPGLYDGDLVNVIFDGRQAALLRKLAASMKAFSKKAAKDPLGTRPP